MRLKVTSVGRGCTKKNENSAVKLIQSQFKFTEMLIKIAQVHKTQYKLSHFGEIGFL